VNKQLGFAHELPAETPVGKTIGQTERLSIRAGAYDLRHFCGNSFKERHLDDPVTVTSYCYAVTWTSAGENGTPLSSKEFHSTQQIGQSEDRSEAAHKVNRTAGGGRDPSAQRPCPTNGTPDPCLPTRCKPGQWRAQERDLADPDRGNRSECGELGGFSHHPISQPRSAILRGPAINCSRSAIQLRLQGTFP